MPYCAVLFYKGITVARIQNVENRKGYIVLEKAVGILSVILYLNFGSIEAMSLNICLCPSLSAQRVGSYTGMIGPLCI